MRERQTDRQTDRQTHIARERQRQRERKIEKGIERHRQTQHNIITREHHARIKSVTDWTGKKARQDPWVLPHS